MVLNNVQQSDLLPELLREVEADLNLSNFALFLSVMKNKKAHECVLSIIMNEADLELKEIKVEQVVLNKSRNRAIRLDAWALDMKERQFSTEMQNDTNADDVKKRSRYYQGLLDTPILKSGKETRYRQLPSTIIIFITQEDIWKRDRAMYTFTERCREIPGLELEDGTKKIFLNMTSKRGRKDLVSLLQYMKNTDLNNPEIIVKDKRIRKLDQIVTEVKQSEEWEAVQMNILDVGIRKGKEIGLEEGLEAGRLEGLEMGRLEGLRVFILDNIEEGISPERILMKLQKRFDLTEEQAREYLLNYTNPSVRT